MRAGLLAFGVYVSLGLLSGLAGLASLSAHLNAETAAAPASPTRVVLADVPTPAPTPVDLRAPLRVVPRPTPAPAPVPATPVPDRLPWSLLFVVNGDLWETAGGAPLQLTQDGSISQPALSDGSLAFTRRARNASDIWLATPDEAPRSITRDSSTVVAQNHWASQPVFVPGEPRLYVLGDFTKSSTGVGNLAVWELSLEQSRPVQITRPPEYGGGDQDITANPSNPGQIIFTRYAYTGSELSEQLEWLDIASSTLVPLTQPDRPARQAQFSPAGDQVAFIQQDPGAQQNLYVADLTLTGNGNGTHAELSNPRLAAAGVLANPTWAADGSGLAYVAETGDRFQVWTLAVERADDGTQRFGPPRQVTSGPGVDATSRPLLLAPDQAEGVRRWLGGSSNPSQ